MAHYESSDSSILRPGSHRATAVTSDAALVNAMLRVEMAWLRALEEQDVTTRAQTDAVAAAVDAWVVDLGAIAAFAESSGNPAVPLVDGLRTQVADPALARLVHRGLTSQDVLDTALILVARDAADRVLADVRVAVAAAAGLADQHRDTVLAGRTLTQHAVPTTFGLVAAQWLVSLLDAGEGLTACRSTLPVQCGGAAGTRSLIADLVPDPKAASAALARQLDLVDPDLPWHTRRRPVGALADAMVTVTDALGSIAAEVALLSRPEIGELSEAGGPGIGGSSTMPQKANPVHSVLVRAACLRAPLLAAQVHLSAAQQVDQRADGAWHCEWPALQELCTLAVTAAGQSKELLEGLVVHAEVMRDRAHVVRRLLLAERYGGVDEVPDDAVPEAYTGQAAAFVDAALDRYRVSVG